MPGKPTHRFVPSIKQAAISRLEAGATQLDRQKKSVKTGVTIVA